MKRTPLEIKRKILDVLRKDGPTSVKKLEKKVNTNYQTILNNCEELEYFGLLKVRETSDGAVNGRPYLLAELLQRK